MIPAGITALSTPWRLLGLALLGAFGAVAFPLVIAPLSPLPINDFLPRELAIVVLAAGVYARLGVTPRLGRAAAEVWCVGCGYFALLIWWVDVAMSRFGGMPQWQAVPALAL